MASASRPACSWRSLRLASLALVLPIALGGAARARGGLAVANDLLEEACGAPSARSHASATPEDVATEDCPPSFAGERLPGAEPTIAFAIDVSRSMAWTSTPFAGLDGAPARAASSRLERVRVELARALEGLPANARFNVITFSHCVSAWKPRAVLATGDTRRDAAAFLGGACAAGSSNAAGAVLRALEDAPIGTVVLVADGPPTYLDCERRFAADAITHRSLIAAGNLQGARIDCIGIEPDASAREFLEGVARDSGGRFVAVE